MADEPKDQQTAQEPPKDGNPGKDTGTGAAGAPGPDGGAGDPPKGEQPQTFTREYVQQLRDEAAGYRTRAKDRDEVAKRLHTELVRQTGRLVAAEELPYADEHLADPAKLTEAIDALLAAKPYLESRTPRGDVGQGAQGDTSEAVGLGALLRAGA